jgi:hypothetical protein
VKSGKRFYNVVYFDDIFITGDDIPGIQQLQTFLNHKFDKKDILERSPVLK